MAKAAQVKEKTEESGIPVRADQPFFTLYQAWLIKGAIGKWQGFRRYRYIQPKGGLYDDKIGGKGVFTRETVMEWITLTDKDMEAYNRKYRTGAKCRWIKRKGKPKQTA
jgi:hypothetical protein